MKGMALLIGVNSVDPAEYDGWEGFLPVCENDAVVMDEMLTKLKFKTKTLLTRAPFCGAFFFPFVVVGVSSGTRSRSIPFDDMDFVNDLELALLASPASISTSRLILVSIFNILMLIRS